MSNSIGVSGITIQTLPEIVTDIIEGSLDTPGLKQIYGSAINVDQNSPDAQMVNIYALSKQDVLDLIVQDYNAKDPDQAVGVALDGVSQLCGITRRAGTYTETEIVVTTDRVITLNGQDTSTPFTVSDASGNLFQLKETATLINGANTLDFIAVDIGAIQVSINTITTATTVILGVVSVNNPSVPTIYGQDEETDAQMRLRRQASVALPAQGCLGGLLGGLYTIDGVDQAIVYENTDAAPDGGIPGHGIWVICNGGDNTEIAEMIYKYRPLGISMAGSSSVNVTQADGSLFEILFDKAVAQDLYVQFSRTSKSGGSIDDTALKAALAAQLDLGIYEMADITTITDLLHVINPDLIIYNVGVSDNAVSYANSTVPAALLNFFTLTAANIDIV